MSTKWKSDQSLVTDTDRTIESLYRAAVKKEFPDHSIMGEEEGGDLNSGGYTWIIDPLDGTTNFASLVPLFCTMVALSHRGQIVCAVVYGPVQDVLFSATADTVAQVNGKPLPPPSTNSELSKTTLLIDSGKDRQIRKQTDIFVEQVGSSVRSVRRFGCMLPSLLLAAAGKLELSIILGIDIYDVAGVSLILNRANYQVIDSTAHDWHVSTVSNMVITTEALLSTVKPLLSKL